MRFAPVGLFGLVAGVIAKAGYKATGPLAVFAIAVLAALAVHAFITLPVLLRVVPYDSNTYVHSVRCFRWKLLPILLTGAG